MKVYLLVHDDRWYDMGDMAVRGVYLDRITALADVITRTPSGRVSRAYGAHTASCCSVEEWDVETGPKPDIRDDPVEVPNTGGILIPAGFLAEMAETIQRSKPSSSARIATNPSPPARQTPR